MSQAKQRRIAFDAIEYATFQVLLKGPMAKDGYILLATFKTFDEAKLIYDWFPNVPGSTLKITNFTGSTVRGCKKTHKPINSGHIRFSALDLIEQSNDLWDVVIAGRLRVALADQPKAFTGVEEEHKAPEPAWEVKTTTVVKDDLVRIANQATKRNQFLSFIKAMADAVKPDLKLIKGGR
jgi:hypothetical protein